MIDPTTHVALLEAEFAAGRASRDAEVKLLREQLAEAKRLHSDAVQECQRAFNREAATAKEMKRRDARGSNPRTSPQLGWDILREQLAAANELIRTYRAQR